MNARDGEAVRGERTTAIVQATHSLQSRLGSLLAAGLMIALGFSALTWYYAHALTRGTHAREIAQSNVAGRAQGEMPLPPLRIEPPASALAGASAAKPFALDSEASGAPPLAAVRSDPLPVPTATPTPLAEVSGGYPAASAASAPVTTVDRRLSGAVLARGGDSETSHALPPQPERVEPAVGLGESDTGAASDALHGSARVSDPGGETLSSRLRASVAPAAPARLLPTQRFLLPQGSFIDCTLETAIDSTLPGMTTCISATDTFGADGKVVLLERGTKFVGETRGQVQQGQARVFVLWSQARTPAGVVVPLASPGTDELGRSGVAGEVQRHFWQRFGAAMLISLIDGAVQAGVEASARSNGSALIYAPSASQGVLTEVLRGTVGIAPTVVKHNGDRIQILVARDLDFRPVYELRAAAGH